MRHEIAEVKNVMRLGDASDALLERATGVPGMGLIWGQSGFGKTTAAAWLAVRTHAVFVRAVSTWTPTAMLASIMKELEAEPLNRTNAMLQWVVESLTRSGRPLMVDEGDYLCGNKKLLDTLRDLHDMSTVPVLMIGMADFRRKVSHQPQLAGRISQWCEFGPADLEDCRTLAESICEVEVSDDLLEQLFKETGGSMRGLTVGLSRIESQARRAKVERITSAEWGNKPFVLPSERRVA